MHTIRHILPAAHIEKNLVYQDIELEINIYEYFEIHEYQLQRNFIPLGIAKSEVIMDILEVAKSSNNLDLSNYLRSPEKITFRKRVYTQDWNLDEFPYPEPETLPEELREVQMLREPLVYIDLQ